MQSLLFRYQTTHCSLAHIQIFDAFDKLPVLTKAKWTAEKTQRSKRNVTCGVCVLRLQPKIFNTSTYISHQRTTTRSALRANNYSTLNTCYRNALLSA